MEKSPNHLKKQYNVEVLISAMHLQDISIVDRTNIQTDVVLINQCDVEDYKIIQLASSTVKYFSSTERGLSNSRNKAIELATSNICLLCDDDEYLYKDYDILISNAYSKMPFADILIFKIIHPTKKYWRKVEKIGFFEIPKISSWQITFKKHKILEKDIVFNNEFGAGAIYSAGEENLFLYDCLRKGLKIYYVPIEIGKVSQEDSTWFKGFNKKYFFDKGAWLAACFPRLKYLLIFYVTIRFIKLSEMNIIETFKFLWNGMRAYKNKISFIDFSEKIKLRNN